jgi:phenylacetate-CoA ligase
MNREKIYSWLPVPLQHAAVSYEGRRIRRFRFEAEFHELLNEYKSRTFMSRQEVLALRDRRLSEFVLHAATTVPYYQELFARLKLDPRDVRTPDDLKVLPILKKSDVQELGERLWSQAVDPRTVRIERTSGSTGGGLRFPMTFRANREHWAVYARYLGWHGLDPLHTWCLHFGGRVLVPRKQRRPPYWRWNYPGKQLLFSAYHLGPATAADYLRAMERSGATWIHGYTSQVTLIAGYALQHRAQLPIRWVSLASENVMPHQIETIERAFGVRPVQHYAMGESVANFSLCPLGKLHVDEDYAAVEFEPAADGSYLVLGTNFTNPVFPLLRYDPGDLATLDDTGAGCACGRPGRVVQSVDGRKEDYIVTRSGAKLGRLNLAFVDLMRIREIQIFQDKPGFMEVRIVRGPGYNDEDEQRARAELDRRVGGDVDYTIEYRDALERTPSGKLRFVISQIK